MRFLTRSLAGIFLLALTLALLGWAGSILREAVVARMNDEPGGFTQRERVLSVNVLEVAPQTIRPELTVFGELRSARTLDVRSAVGGTVVDVSENLVEGGRVEAGDVLLRLDPTDAEVALARVEADLRDAQAELRDAERALDLARDDLASAQEQAELRDKALARQVDLLDRGVGTAAAVETAELSAASARQAVVSRRQALAQAEARVEMADSQIARQELNRSEAERTLADTTIRAAFAGTLTGVTVVNGGRVTANEQVAQLIDPDALEVAFQVSTAQYARLLDADGRLRQVPVTVRLDLSGVNLAATGELTRDAAQVSQGQTGRLLFARLDQAAGFRPGDFVTVSVIEPPLENVARVPATAVDAAETVLVVGDEERLRAAPVEVLRTQGDDVIIAADGVAGAVIVAERSPLLGSGIRVNPIDRSAPPAAPAPPEMIELSEERRARLVAFVEANNRMPEAAKTRLLSQLEQPSVPAETVSRLEGRMGG